MMAGANSMDTCCFLQNKERGGLFTEVTSGENFAVVPRQ